MKLGAHFSISFFHRDGNSLCTMLLVLGERTSVESIFLTLLNMSFISVLHADAIIAQMNPWFL